MSTNTAKTTGLIILTIILTSFMTKVILLPSKTVQSRIDAKEVALQLNLMYSEEYIEELEEEVLTLRNQLEVYNLLK